MEILKAFIVWIIMMGGITMAGFLVAGVLTLVIEWLATRYKS